MILGLLENLNFGELKIMAIWEGRHAWRKFKRNLRYLSGIWEKVLQCKFLSDWGKSEKPLKLSETGRIRFRRVRFQTPNSVSFLGLTEFRWANSVSSSQPIICVPKQTHRVFRRTHRVCRRTQWVLSSETVLSKQYSARSLNYPYLFQIWLRGHSKFLN